MRLNRFLKQAFFKNALLFAFCENRVILSLRALWKQSVSVQIRGNPKVNLRLNSWIATLALLARNDSGICHFEPFAKRRKYQTFVILSVSEISTLLKRNFALQIYGYFAALSMTSKLCLLGCLTDSWLLGLPCSLFGRTFKDKSSKFVILSGVRKHKAKNPYFKVQSAL